MYVIGVHRHSRYTGRGLRIMDYLRRHLIEAHRNAIAVSGILPEQSRLENILDACARAIMILKESREIEFSTAMARRWMHEYFDGDSRPDRLPKTLELWIHQHDPSIRKILGLPRPCEALVVNRRSRRLVVRMLTDADTTTLILEEQITVLDPASIVSLGLSRRECEVLALTADGRSTIEIAATLGTSRRTVEAHSRRINQHLGVSNRTAAAAIAFQTSRLSRSATPPTDVAESRARIVRKLRDQD